MASVIGAIRPRMPLASSRPRCSATAVELSLGFAIILRRRAVIARACIIPAIVATTRTPASRAAASMVLDHDDGGQESTSPAAMVMSSDAVPPFRTGDRPHGRMPPETTRRRHPAPLWRRWRGRPCRPPRWTRRSTRRLLAVHLSPTSCFSLVRRDIILVFTRIKVKSVPVSRPVAVGTEREVGRHDDHSDRSSRCDAPAPPRPG